MTQSDLKCSSDSKGLKVTQGDSKWLKVTQSDSKWLKVTQMTPSDSKRLKLLEVNQSDLKWLKVTQSDSKWLKLLKVTQSDSKWLTVTQSEGLFSLSSKLTSRPWFVPLGPCFVRGPLITFMETRRSEEHIYADEN